MKKDWFRRREPWEREGYKSYQDWVDVKNGQQFFGFYEL